MTITVIVAAFIAVLACICTLYVAGNVFLRTERIRDHLDVQDSKIQRLQSQRASDERWTREEIRDSVDNYLQTLDISPSSGMDEGMLMQMMMGMMGAGQQPQEQPEEQPATTLYGGNNNAES